jgi:hypothetical protein
MYASFAPPGAAAALGIAMLGPGVAGGADGRPLEYPEEAQDGMLPGTTVATAGSGVPGSGLRLFAAAAGRPQAWQKASPSLIDDRQYEQVCGIV